MSTADLPLSEPAAVSLLSDKDLIAAVARLALRERRATANLIRSLMEFDARRLYLGEGYSSLFAYCTQVLNYAEHAALNRIEISRAARRCPRLLDLIAEGALHLSGARLLVPHLTDENCDALLLAATHKSKRQIEEIVAALHPQPAAVSMVRKLPCAPALPARPPVLSSASEPGLALVPAACPPALADRGSTPSAPAPGAAATSTVRGTPSALSPLAPERYRLQFTITGETRDRLRRVQDLLRHTIPDGDPAAIFDRALVLLEAELERTRFASTAKPRGPQPVAPDSQRIPASGSRHIPAGVKREVWRREGGQCAFTGARGRCAERGFLEFHHVVPFAAGGEATTANIELRCRAHNAYEASLFFGAPPDACVREPHAETPVVVEPDSQHL